MHDVHYRGLERLYAEAPCNRDVAMTLEVGEGTARVLFAADPGRFHGGGGLHGHVLFKALDDAAFFAANSLLRDQLVATVEFHVRFLRPVREGALEAVGKVVQRSRRLLVAEAAIVGPRGREIARGSGSFLPSGVLLTVVPGYGQA